MNNTVPLKEIDSIIFDIDGTLVDTSASYTEVIKETLKIYLSLFIKGEIKAELLLNSGEVNAFKQLGGYNNDWDTVAAVLYYYVSLIPEELLAKSCRLALPEQRDVRALIDQLKGAMTEEFSFKELIAKKDILGFVESLRVQKIFGLRALRALLKEQNSWLILCGGSLIDKNLVQRIYQELYQGGELFRTNYGHNAIFHAGEGYCQRETLLADKQLLTRLAGKKKLGVATGRLKMEAEMVLDNFGIKDLFRCLVADDDILEEQRKPAPEILYLAAKRLGGESYAYVGDLPDDVKAANQAKTGLSMVSVVVGDRVAGADHYFPRIDDFLQAIV
ncbi:MAG: HAD-IA family hydrolase [Candidatus Margulisiibacteriota bacterium]|jgi:HAD superfamily hydrolase (TIGR01548 family)